MEGYTPGNVILIITALGIVIVNIIVALRSSKQIMEVSAKTDVIAGHVNSNATRQIVKIESLQKEVAALNQLLADKVQVAAVLAQSVANEKAVEVSANK